MRKVLLLAATYILLGSVSAQIKNEVSTSNQHSVVGKDGVIRNPEVIPVVLERVTSPWRDIAAHASHIEVYHDGDWGERYEREEEEEREGMLQGRRLNKKTNPNALPIGEDPLLQKHYNSQVYRSSQIANWEGMTTNTMPGDPAMDVGPNHVVQMINSGANGSDVKIWDKTGTVLLAQTAFHTLAGTTQGLGDPIVLYDERADRWMLTEFSTQSTNKLYIAISQTPDPTGAYYIYSVTTNSFPDYPKYAIWDNSYIVTSNESSDAVYVMDRSAMLTGGAPNAQRFTMPHYNTITFQVATPVSLMGTTVSGDNCMLMRIRDDGWTGVTSDALEMWEVNINWSNPTASTMSQTQVLPVSPYDSQLCGYTGFSCIPQPSGQNPLDPLREILMNRIMYRNFGTHESIVCAHVTDVNGNDLAGIRWYELRRTGGPTANWSIYQEGTYQPGTDNRWMPTIGISASGNIGLAFNVSSSAVFPDIRYTGRKVCDPLGQMTEPETVLVSGTTSNNTYRWGDYNAMGVDPTDGETFWFDAQYNPASQAHTRIGAFKINSCTPQVQFVSSTYTVNEPDANVVNGCLDYYVLNVPVEIANAPTQPASITVNVTGGTATQNVDYTIQHTTFNLGNPSLVDTVKILVYNDNYVEGPETITLDYTLNANGGNATTGTINQTCTITINDDDLAPANMLGATTNILTQDFEAGLGTFTSVNNAGGANNLPWQVGNAAAASSQFYAPPTTNNTQFAYVNDDACNCTMNSVDLIFPVIDLSNYISASINFDAFYRGKTYNGSTESANLMVSINGGTYSTVAAVTPDDVNWTNQTVDITPYVGNASVQFKFNYSDGTGWLYGCSIDNIVINGQGHIDIQQAVNTTTGMTAELGPNSTVHFYDPATNDVMISLTNTSTWDYGCVTVEVDRDGTTPTALPFNTNNTPDYLHGKTYKVTPTNNNPSGTYDITLYYKEAEVAAWESITGNVRTNAQIIKVAGNNRINDVTPTNYTTFTIDNIPATVGAFNADVTFTASFTTGFSGFGVGIYNNPTTVISHTTVNTNPTCNGGSDGSIVVTAVGGTAPYQYSIDGGTTWQTSNTFNGLAAGTYSVVVKDAGSNMSTPSTEILTAPAAITYTNTTTDPTCNAGTDGTITITGSGGTGALQYSIDNGTTFQATGSFTGLASGTYNVIVKDINGCQATGTITLNNPIVVAYTNTSTNPSCNAGTDGTITLTGSGGTGALQYSIDNGTTFQATGAFTGLAAGTYNIVVKDANGCQTTGTVTLTDPTVVAYTVSSQSNPTCGGNDGAFTLAGSGGTGTYQYSIDGGTTFQASGTFTALAAGTYNIVVKDANGCQTTGTLILNNPTTITYTVSSQTDPTCNGGSDGSFTLAGSGGTGTFQYSIDGGTTFQASGSFTGLAAGTYNVVVKDANNCQATGTVTLNNPVAVSYTVTSQTDPTCNGGNDGTFTLSGSNGVGSYQYSIDGGTTFQASGSFSGLTATTYNVVVQDANGCQGSGTVTLNNPSAVAYTNTKSNPTCNGGSDGAITLTGSGGAGSYQYSIDGGTTFQATGAFTGLAAGTYNIVVKDANGCQTTGTVSLIDPTAVSYTNSTVDPTCNGGNDGTITLTGSGGQGSLQYSIDGGTTFQSTGSYTALTSGSYNVVIKDANGCQATGTITLNNPTAVSYTAAIVGENCNANDGSITLTGSGGTGALQYSIDGGTTFQASGSFTGLAAGLYNVVVKDANGCQATGSETVNSIGGVSITSVTKTNLTCNGDGSGQIVISSSGGTGTITYSIDGGTTTQTNGTFTGLSAGTYNIVVSDANGCTATSTATLTEPTAISYTATTTNENCGSTDGSISITANGGTGAFQYSIDGGTTFQSGNTFNGLTAGTYNVVITDANSCQTSGTETIGTNGGPTISSVTPTNLTCNGAGNGSISITASGGTAPLQYSVNGGGTFQGTGTFNGLSAGTYNIVVQDAGGCQSTSTTTLTEPTAVSYTSSIVNENCGAGDGSITLTGAGGNGTYQYSIDGGTTFQTNGSFTNLSSGVYSVVVKDVNGCTTTGSESVNSTGGANIMNTSSTNPSCYGQTDGSITVVATGGTSPLQYSIDGGNTFQSSSSFSGLSGGLYTIVVQDANGCQSITSASLTDPSQIQTSISTVEATCGNSDGSATVSVFGGAGSFTYQWDDSNNQTTATASNLPAGLYHVTVTDANGCSVTDSTYISNIGDPTLILSSSDVSCYGGNNGEAVVEVVGGILPYTVTWSDPMGQTTDTASNLFTGTYTVQVVDNAGCTAFGTITISQPALLTVTISGINTSCAMDNGLATANVSGGTAPYSYAWDDSNNQTTSTAINLVAGSYVVNVADANGCTAFDSVTLLNSDSLVVTVDVVHESCEGKSDGSIVTTVASGQSPFSYLWSTGDTTSSIANLTAGEYTVSVSDANNCSSILLIPIETIGGNCIVIPTAISPNNDGQNDVWYIEGLNEYPGAKIEIYNRWGGLLYSTTDYQNDWNGRYKGQNVPAGVYYYIVQLSEDETYTGSLTIIR